MSQLWKRDDGRSKDQSERTRAAIRMSISLLKLDQAAHHCDARGVAQGEVRSMSGNQEAIQRCQARLIDEHTRLIGQTGRSTSSDCGLMRRTHPKAANETDWSAIETDD